MDSNKRTSASSKSLDELTLIIVHANGVHNPSEAGVENIKHLIDTGIAGRIYEHRAYGHSQVKHKGVILNNDENPGFYIIPNLEGSKFILVGGGIGDCHFGAYFAILAQRWRKDTEVHMPTNCIFSTHTIHSSGEEEEYSKATKPYDPRLQSYIEVLKFFSGDYSVSIDGTEIKKAFFGPLVHLFIWSDHYRMLDSFPNQDKK